MRKEKKKQHYLFQALPLQTGIPLCIMKKKSVSTFDSEQFTFFTSEKIWLYSMIKVQRTYTTFDAPLYSSRKIRYMTEE